MKIPSLKTIAIGFIGAFFAIQIISLVLNAILPSIPLLKGGNAIFLILLSVGIMALFIIGTNLEQLKSKESLVFIVIVFGLIVLAYYKLPEYFPQLFSLSPETAYSIKQTIGSIINIGG